MTGIAPADVWPSSVAADDRSLWTAKLFPSMVDPPIRPPPTDDDDDSNNSTNNDGVVDASPSCVLWLQSIAILASLSPSDPLYVTTMFNINQWRRLSAYDQSVAGPGSPVCDSYSHSQSYRYSLADLILLGDATSMALWRSYLQQAVLIMYPLSMTTTTTRTIITATDSVLPVVYNSSYNSSIATTYRRLIRYAYDTAASRQVDVFTVFSDLLLQWCTEFFLPPVSNTTHDTTNKGNNCDDKNDDIGDEVDSHCLLDGFLPPYWRENLELRRYDTRHLPVSKQKITMSRIPMLILCLSRHLITQSEQKRLVQTLLSWIPTSHLADLSSTPHLLSTERSVGEEAVPRLLLFLNWLTEYTPLYVDPSVDLLHVLTGDVMTSDEDANNVTLSDYFEAKAKVCVMCMYTLPYLITYRHFSIRYVI